MSKSKEGANKKLKNATALMYKEFEKAADFEAREIEKHFSVADHSWPLDLAMIYEQIFYSVFSTYLETILFNKLNKEYYIIMKDGQSLISDKPHSTDPSFRYGPKSKE